jgi:hypothetical protein
MLCQAYGYEVLNKTTPYKWYKCFQSGRTSAGDKMSGQPFTSRNEMLIAQMSYRRKSVWKFQDM